MRCKLGKWCHRQMQSRNIRRRKTAITREEDALFGACLREDQGIRSVGWYERRIVTRGPQPAGEMREHGIAEKTWRPKTPHVLSARLSAVDPICRRSRSASHLVASPPCLKPTAPEFRRQTRREQEIICQGTALTLTKLQPRRRALNHSLSGMGARVHAHRPPRASSPTAPTAHSVLRTAVLQPPTVGARCSREGNKGLGLAPR